MQCSKLFGTEKEESNLLSSLKLAGERQVAAALLWHDVHFKLQP